MKKAELVQALADRNLPTDGADRVGRCRELAEKKVTPEEIKKVIGLSQLMGVVQYPSLQMYWSNEVPLFNCQIASVMSRDRFRAVASALTQCDRRMKADLKQKCAPRDCNLCSHPSCMKFLCMDRGCHTLYHDMPDLFHLPS